MPDTGGNSVRVRMYRHGLGDCFLLTFSTGGEPFHLLIDCGVLKGTGDADRRMQDVARNVHEVTGGHLDVLVATHEHWDHLSGFLQAQAIFDTVSVGAVWLAWTEDPEDDLANELRRKKARTTRAIEAAAQRLQGVRGPAARSTAERLNALLDFQGDFGAGATKTTAKAMEWVKSRQAPPPVYLRPGEERSGSLPLGGVRIYVLGPPHDRASIKRSDPSKRHSEVYELMGGVGDELGFFAATDALSRDEAPEELPFDDWFSVGEPDAHEAPFFRRHYHGRGDAWRRIDDDWLGVAGRLALQLDSDTNNTSLVLAFELPDGRVLLFPGDAQVGNWLSWGALAWELGPAGELRTVATADLLARTVLYKVGHHGSHNATLREQGLELMTSGELVAMIPVNRVTAHKKKWNMPFPPLYRRLRQRTRGRILDAELGVGDRPSSATEDEWQRFLAATDVQPGWVDYTLEW